MYRNDCKSNMGLYQVLEHVNLNVFMENILKVIAIKPFFGFFL